MKRDFELIRKILLFVEGIDNTSRLEKLEIDGYTSHAIDHHVRMLLDQGFLRERGSIHFAIDGIRIGGGAMTYTGHDFLDTARNDTIWRKVMTRIASTTGTASIEVVTQLLVAQGKQMLGLPE